MPDMKDTRRVSIIIPHYNQKECLRTLLLSVANQTIPDCEVIILDDRTPDESVVEYIETLIADHKNMRLVRNAENMRFIKTVNKGLTLANGEYICLLNSDTELGSSFIQRNVEVLDADATIGALSCVVVDKDGRNWFSGGILRSGFPITLTDDFQGIRSVDWVAGTAVFYRRDVFDRIGIFDESYRMYHEDVEFGLRMRAQTSYRACTFAEKLVTHYVVPSIPTSELFYLLRRNHILMLREHLPRYLPRAALSYFVETARALAGSLITANPKKFRLALSGLHGVLAGLVKRQSRRLPDSIRSA